MLWVYTILLHYLSNTFQISKRQVDQFVPGRLVPSCQLYVKWTGGQEQPVELLHRVELLGAKEPFNFFLIRLPSLPPPLTPQSMCSCIVVAYIYPTCWQWIKYSYPLHHLILLKDSWIDWYWANSRDSVKHKIISYAAINIDRLCMLRFCTFLPRWSDWEYAQQTTVKRSDGCSLPQGGRQMEDNWNLPRNPKWSISRYFREMQRQSPQMPYWDAGDLDKANPPSCLLGSCHWGYGVSGWRAAWERAEGQVHAGHFFVFSCSEIPTYTH